MATKLHPLRGNHSCFIAVPLFNFGYVGFSDGGPPTYADSPEPTIQRYLAHHAAASDARMTIISWSYGHHMNIASSQRELPLLYMVIPTPTTLSLPILYYILPKRPSLYYHPHLHARKYYQYHQINIMMVVLCRRMMVRRNFLFFFIEFLGYVYYGCG